MRSQWAKPSRAFLKLTRTHSKSSLINSAPCCGTKGAATASRGLQRAHFWDVCVLTDGVPKPRASGSRTPLLSFSRGGQRKCFFCEPVHFCRSPQAVYCPSPATFPYPTLLYALSASLQFPPSGSALSTTRPLLPLSLPPPLRHPFISPSALALPFSFPPCALDRLALIKLIAMVIHLNGLLSPLWRRQRRRQRRRRPHRCSTMAGWLKSKSSNSHTFGENRSYWETKTPV